MNVCVSNRDGGNGGTTTQGKSSGRRAVQMTNVNVGRNGVRNRAYSIDEEAENKSEGGKRNHRCTARGGEGVFCAG